VLGFGASSDGHHMVQPRPDGSEAARAIVRALHDGGTAEDEIEYVNAHATSTPLGDLAEAVAIRLALGRATDSIPVSGTKALYGHPLGASGAIETVLSALVIRHAWAPATANLAAPDPGVVEQLPALLGEPCARPFRRVLSTSFGFGGLNAALVLGAPDG
jgi:3-oxoacyl-[acyl-carrier-protein] synthase II